MRIIFVHLMCVFALSVRPARAADDVAMPLLPSAIEAAEDLRRYLEMMLRRSATFRQQCLRREAPRLRVQIRRDAQFYDKPYQARTTIQRSAGSIVASVVITAFGDPTEWLAHEFEHVIEQIEGVNLRQVMQAREGAWQTVEGSFETTRAIRAGETVRQEVRERHRALARAAAGPESGGRAHD